MASTVNSNTFRVNIKEEHIVGGQRTVHENFYRIPNVTNYDRRIVTVPNTTSIDLINTNGLNPAPGTFPSSSVKYGRITNMDDSNTLAVNFTSSTGVSGILFPSKPLYPSFIAGNGSGGTGGTAATYTAVVTKTDGSGTGATLNVTTGVSDGSLADGTTLAIAQNTVVDFLNSTFETSLFLSSNNGGSGAQGYLVFTAPSATLTLATIRNITYGEGGSGYAVGDTITITVAQLNAIDGLSGATQDLILGPIIAANILNKVEAIDVNGQGEGYAIGNELKITGSLLGGSSNLTYTLGASDFTTNEPRAYWTMECRPTSSIMFSSVGISGSQFTGTFGSQIEFISMFAISSSIDVEYVIVNA